MAPDKLPRNTRELVDVLAQWYPPAIVARPEDLVDSARFALAYKAGQHSVVAMLVDRLRKEEA